MNEESIQVGDTVIVTDKTSDREEYPHFDAPGKVIDILDDGWIVVTWDDLSVTDEFHPSELAKVSNE